MILMTVLFVETGMQVVLGVRGVFKPLLKILCSFLEEG